MKHDFFYRISPAIGGGNKKIWQLDSVTKDSRDAQVVRTIAYFPSIKAAKDVVAHFRKKPIEL